MSIIIISNRSSSSSSSSSSNSSSSNPLRSPGVLPVLGGPGARRLHRAEAVGVGASTIILHYTILYYILYYV